MNWKKNELAQLSNLKPEFLNRNELKEIIEQIKSTLGIEQLDELEREYNRMYKELKEKEEQKKALTTNES